MAYIDTSVLVAYYWPEALSRAAQAEIRRAKGPSISPLSELEFISALALKIRTGEINEKSARLILSTFRQHRADNVYQILPIEAREYEIACEWIGMFRTSLRALDALHMAVSFCNGLTLITADRTLAESASQLGVMNKLIR
jgi:predicted nucleic acid-binding protein